MDNRPDENGLVNNHILKSRYLKMGLDLVMVWALYPGILHTPSSDTILEISIEPNSSLQNRLVM